MGSLSNTLIRLACALLLIGCCVATSAAHALELRGRVTAVYDGDTLQVEQLGKIRLLGIDTPEWRDSSRDDFYQRNFKISRTKLRQIAAAAKSFTRENSLGKQLRFVSGKTAKDKYDRWLMYVYLPDGRLLNRVLIEQGLASVYRRFNFSRKQDFLAAETIARKAKRGLWSD